MALFRVLIVVVDSEPTIGKLTIVHLGIDFTVVHLVHMSVATRVRVYELHLYWRCVNAGYVSVTL